MFKLVNLLSFTHPNKPISLYKALIFHRTSLHRIMQKYWQISFLLYRFIFHCNNYCLNYLQLAKKRFKVVPLHVKMNLIILATKGWFDINQISELESHHRKSLSIITKICRKAHTFMLRYSHTHTSFFVWIKYTEEILRHIYIYIYTHRKVVKKKRKKKRSLSMKK